MAQSAATKEELLSEIERLNALLRDREDQLSQQAAASREGERGWMISVPNPEYTGRTAGVYFEKGHAFIPANRKDAARIVAVLTTDYGYSATETNGTEVREPEPKRKQGTVAEQAVVPVLMR